MSYRLYKTNDLPIKPELNLKIYEQRKSEKLKFLMSILIHGPHTIACARYIWDGVWMPAMGANSSTRKMLIFVNLHTPQHSVHTRLQFPIQIVRI